MPTFVGEYSRQLTEGMASIDAGSVEQASEMLLRAIGSGRRIYACGNGGSAAISDHLACDHLKGVATDTPLRPKVYSLVANSALTTAIANDLSYADIFSYQIDALGEKGDVLIATSSSGNSENIVRALRSARVKEMGTVALVGFDGGRALSAADIAIHVKVANYGIVEDCHQAIMHILAQYLRLKALPRDKDLGRLKF